MTSFLRLFLLILTITVSVTGVQAQVNISSFSPVTENFNALPASGSAAWVNNTTLKGWYARSGGVNPATISASAGTASNVSGIRSFGSTSSTDRSLGCVNTGTNQTYYGVQLKNQTGTTIKRFVISYTLELWAKPNGNKTITVNFHSQVGTNTVLTSGTWVSQPKGAITRKTGGGYDKPLDGNLAKYRTRVTFTTSDINLAANASVMLRWSDLNVNGVYSSIDDISITPTNANMFFSKPTGDLTTLSTWGTNPDGSGLSPLLFANATFVYANRAYTTLTKNWAVLNGKVIVSEGVLVIPATFSYNGVMDVSNDAYLAIANQLIPTFDNIGDNSNIIFNGSGDQILPFANYSNLFIMGSGKKILSANTIVRKSLVFTDGKILLGKFNLTMIPGADIIDASEAGYIITNSTGSLIQEVANDNLPVLFPIGTTTYAPATLTQPLTAAPDNFQVRAFDTLYTAYKNNLPAGRPITEKVVNKTWIVDEEVTGGSAVTLTIGWKKAQTAKDFDVREARIRHFYDNEWDDFLAEPVVEESGYYFLTRPNISSFSPFGSFSGQNGTLPVKLVSFTANRQDKGITCNWKTATEQNNDFFTVERSLNAREFTAIGRVKGAGTSNAALTYQFRDSQAPEGTVYYRLKQTDLDGSISYSEIVTAKAGNAIAAFTLYPNPASSFQTIKASNTSSEPVMVTIRNGKGQEVKQHQATGSQLIQGLELDISGLAPGLYFVEIRTGNQKTILKSLKQ